MFNSAESRDIYKKLEGEVKNKIKNAKRGIEKKLAYSQNGNSRQFANYIKSKTKAKISVGPLKDKSGKMISDEKEIANELNAFFSSVFTIHKRSSNQHAGKRIRDQYLQYHQMGEIESSHLKSRVNTQGKHLIRLG